MPSSLFSPLSSITCSFVHSHLPSLQANQHSLWGSFKATLLKRYDLWSLCVYFHTYVYILCAYCVLDLLTNIISFFRFALQYDPTIGMILFPPFPTLITLLTIITEDSYRKQVEVEGVACLLGILSFTLLFTLWSYRYDSLYFYTTPYLLLFLTVMTINFTILIFTKNNTTRSHQTNHFHSQIQKLIYY